MSSSISMKSLARLQFRQFFRGKKGRDLIGPAFIIFYFWLLALILALKIKQQLPPLTGVIVFASFLIPDLLLKVILERDHTVMDAFLKTRPVPQGLWDRFLSVSQFWNPANLMLPVCLLPACFLFLPFPLSLVVLVTLYLFSVFGGFLVMLIKHRGTYESEKTVKVKKNRAVKSTTGNAVFGLQSKSLLRSKRLRTALIYMSAVMLFMFVDYGWAGIGQVGIFQFFFIMLASSMLPQYGLGVEAGFISAIWTRPVPISRILEDKFRFAAILGGLAALITIPFCIWFKIPVYVSIAYALFSVGVGSMFLLIDAYKCGPFDLFGKAFFNYQGTGSTFKASTFLVTFFIMLMGMLLPHFLSDLAVSMILGGLGLIGFAFHKSFFRRVERKFLDNRYTYLEKYLSK